MKKQEEHEEAREERARLREERKVAEELAQPCVPTSRETLQHWKLVNRAGETMRHDEIQDRRPSAEP